MIKRKINLSVIILLLSMNVYAQLPGSIVVTEFMADPASVTDANGEWFEILNVSINTIDIDGWHIKDNGTNDYVINNSGPLWLFPGTVLILAVNNDSLINGGITPDYTYSGFTLANTSDEIIITDQFGIVIDSVAYTNTTPGKSWSLDPSHLNATDNDNFSNWCLASSTYGMGDFGTPGELNDSCNLNYVPELSNNTFNIHIVDNVLVVHLNISEANQKWEIRDIFGKIVLDGIAPEKANEFSIELYDINSGIYFFRLSEKYKTKTFHIH